MGVSAPGPQPWTAASPLPRSVSVIWGTGDLLCVQLCIWLLDFAYGSRGCSEPRSLCCPTAALVARSPLRGGDTFCLCLHQLLGLLCPTHWLSQAAWGVTARLHDIGHVITAVPAEDLPDGFVSACCWPALPPPPLGFWWVCRHVSWFVCISLIESSLSLSLLMCVASRSVTMSGLLWFSLLGLGVF